MLQNFEMERTSLQRSLASFLRWLPACGDTTFIASYIFTTAINIQTNVRARENVCPLWVLSPVHSLLCITSHKTVLVNISFSHQMVFESRLNRNLWNISTMCNISLSLHFHYIQWWSCSKKLRQKLLAPKLKNGGQPNSGQVNFCHKMYISSDKKMWIKCFYELK